MSVKIAGEGIGRFNDWFQSRVRRSCPFCGGREWTVHDEMAITSILEADTRHIDAPERPSAR